MSTLGCVRGVLRGTTALTDRELNDIIADVRGRKAEAMKVAGMTQVELKVREIAMRKAEKLRMEAAMQRRNAANNMIKQRGLLDQRTRYRTTSEWAEAMLDPSNRDVPGARDSVTAKQEAYVSENLAGFVRDMESEGLMPYVATRLRDVLNPMKWGKGVLDDKIAVELWEHSRDGGKPGSTGSKEAQKIAAVIYKWQEKARADLNRLGAFIGKIPGYIVSQSHDMVRIAEAGFKDWYDTISPRLDEARTFENVVFTGDPVKDKNKKVEFLQNVYGSLSRGEFMREAAGSVEKSGFKGSKNVAKSVSQSRVLHFKDAKSWIEYNDKFGQTSLMESVIGGLTQSGKMAGLMEKLGTNPESMFYNMIDHSRLWDRKNGIPADRRLADGGWTDKLWDVVSGAADIPASVRLAGIGSVLRGHQTVTKLGGAVLASLPDMPLAGAVIRDDHGDNLFSATMNQINNVMAQFTDDGARREYAMYMHVGADTVIGDVAMRVTGADTTAPTVVRKGIQAFFKLNGLNIFTAAGERALSFQLGTRLAALRDNAFSKLPKTLQDTLGLYNIGQTEWEIIRKNTLVKVRNRYDLLTADLLRSMPLDQIDPLIEWPLEAMQQNAAESLERVQKKAQGIATKISRLMETLRQQGEFGQLIGDTQAYMDFIKQLQAKTFEDIKSGFSQPIEKFANAVVRFAKRDMKIMDQHADKIAALIKKTAAGTVAKPRLMSELSDAANDLKQLQIAFAAAANDLITGETADITKAARLKDRAQRMQDRIARLTRELKGVDSPAQTVEDLKTLSEYVKTLQKDDFKALVEKHRGNVVNEVAKGVAKFAREDARILDHNREKLKELKKKLAKAKKAEPAVIEKLNELIGYAKELEQVIDEWPDTIKKAMDRRRELAVQELANKLNTYYTDRTHLGVIRAGAREKAYATWATQPGTPEGEAARFISQFKQYPMAFIQRVLGRYAQEDKFLSIPGALAKRIAADPTGVGAQVASLILALTLMGYVSMAMKDIAKGRTPRPPHDPRTWGAAFIQGGGAGLYGDYLFSRVNRFGGTLGEAAMGPTLGTVFEAGDLALMTRDTALSHLLGDGSEEFPDVKAFNFFKNNSPFLNLFYLRSALDYMILYDVQESLSPGSLRRMEQRLKSENKQEFILPPSQNRVRLFTE